MEKLTCPSCGADVEPSTGPGRPRVYCGETCRRTAEFRIRALAKRIDVNEVDLRDLEAGGGFWSPVERRQRVRFLKQWLTADGAELRALLGQSDPKTVQKNQTRREFNQPDPLKDADR